MSADRFRARAGSIFAAIAVTALAAGSAWADRYSDAVAHAGRPAGDIQRDAIDHPAESAAPRRHPPGMRGRGLPRRRRLLQRAAELHRRPPGPRVPDEQRRLRQVERQPMAGAPRRRAAAERRASHHDGRASRAARRARSMPSCSSRCTTISTGNRTRARGRRSIRTQVLTEIARVVRPGGILLLVDHSAKPGTRQRGRRPAAPHRRGSSRGAISRSTVSSSCARATCCAVPTMRGT